MVSNKKFFRYDKINDFCAKEKFFRVKVKNYVWQQPQEFT